MPRLSDDLEGTPSAVTLPRSSLKKLVLLGSVITLTLVGVVFLTRAHATPSPSEPLCPIPALFSANSSAITKRSAFFLSDAEFAAQSYAKLSGAVRVPTEVYDNQPDVEDDPEVWAKFSKFHAYLEETFPTVYRTFKVDKVNTYGLVFTWKGSNTHLKPILLTAHQDVVPVQKQTIKDWKHGPFSGHVGGTFIYGRGTADCKNLLIGLMETAEQLIADGFKPRRSIVLGFGFDEEASGRHGASHIAKFLTEEYGPDSFYAVIDEGSSGLIKSKDGLNFAAVATAEKGYFDALITLTTPGGHSSIPPDHTAIGIMSNLVALLEAEPFEPLLTEANPTLGYLQCVAEHDTTLPKSWAKTIFRAAYDKAANSKVLAFLASTKQTKYLVRTSQAVDIINGGAKANALPEHVSVTSNYRVAIGTSVEDTVAHISAKIKQIATQFNLGYVNNGSEVVLDLKNPNGVFNLTIVGSLEPSPSSPTTNSRVWTTFGGALRHFYKNVVGVEGEVIIAPGIMTGNTDTKYYWALTRNIYRYVPAYDANGTDIMEFGIHSVNEKLPKKTHLHIVAFYYEYLQAIDGESDA